MQQDQLNNVVPEGHTLGILQVSRERCEGMTNAEIVQFIARQNPEEAWLIRFDSLDAQEIHDGLSAAGIPVVLGPDAENLSVTGEDQIAFHPRLNAWSQNTLGMLLKQLASERYFNICNLDKLHYSLSHVREALNLPAVKGMESLEYGVLRGLHCVHYNTMTGDVRAGVPAAVLSVLGLDESTGLMFFGPELWGDVKQSLDQILPTKEAAQQPQIRRKKWFSLPRFSTRAAPEGGREREQ